MASPSTTVMLSLMSHPEATSCMPAATYDAKAYHLRAAPVARRGTISTAISPPRKQMSTPMAMPKSISGGY